MKTIKARCQLHGSKIIIIIIIIIMQGLSLQCFDAVGWAAGRATGL